MTGFNGLDEQPLHFQEIEPMLFREAGGTLKLHLLGKRAVI